MGEDNDLSPPSISSTRRIALWRTAINASYDRFLSTQAFWVAKGAKQEAKSLKLSQISGFCSALGSCNITCTPSLDASLKTLLINTLYPTTQTKNSEEKYSGSLDVAWSEAEWRLTEVSRSWGTQFSKKPFLLSFFRPNDWRNTHCAISLNEWMGAFSIPINTFQASIIPSPHATRDWLL